MQDRRRRAGRISGSSMLLLLLIAVGLAWAGIFGPYFWDEQVVREAAAASLREWRTEESLDRGKNKFANRLEKESIDYIDPVVDCKFSMEGKIRYLECGWVAHVYYPGTNYYKTLNFNTTSECDEDGSVSQY